MQRRLTQILGTIISVLAIGFVVRFFLSLDVSALGSISVGAITKTSLVMLILYIIVMLIGAYAWKMILSYFSESKITFYSTFPVFCQSNLAKYVPGNVFQYAARNFLGNNLGWKHYDIALSSIVEIALGILAFAIAALMAIMFGFAPYSGELHYPQTNQVFLAGSAGVTVLAIILIISKRARALAVSTFQPLITFQFLGVVLLVLPLYLASFVVTGLMLSIVYTSLFGLPFELSDHLVIISVSILAVFIGYVTPGSPGGIGLRESIILLLLAPLYGDSATFIAMFLHRIVSVLGDVLLFLMAMTLPKNKNAQTIQDQSK